jgi:hypothetical protein
MPPELLRPIAQKFDPNALAINSLKRFLASLDLQAKGIERLKLQTQLAIVDLESQIMRYPHTSELN